MEAESMGGTWQCGVGLSWKTSVGKHRYCGRTREWAERRKRGKGVTEEQQWECREAKHEFCGGVKQDFLKIILSAPQLTAGSSRSYLPLIYMPSVHMKFKGQILPSGIPCECCYTLAWHCILWKYDSGLNFDSTQQIWWLTKKNWGVYWCLSAVQWNLIKRVARAWICIWNVSAVFGDVFQWKKLIKLLCNFLLCLLIVFPVTLQWKSWNSARK